MFLYFGWIVWLLCALALIGVGVWLRGQLKNDREHRELGAMDWAAGIFLMLVAIFVVGFVSWGVASALWVEQWQDSTPTSTPIVAMSNETGVGLSGMFLFGTGSVSGGSDIIYKYLVQLPGGDLELRKANAADAKHIYIHEGESKAPRLEVTTPQSRYVVKSGVPQWLAIGFAVPGFNASWEDDTSQLQTYRFFVPSGTVKYVYSVSMGK